MKKLFLILSLFVILCTGMTGCSHSQPGTGNEYKCTLSIECTKAIESEQLDDNIRKILPEDGVIIREQEISFREGQTVYDVLTDACRQNNIPIESNTTIGTQSIYVEGIYNLYEFDCGSNSGWEYTVNGVMPGESCNAYRLKNGDRIVWRYTCELGEDFE